MSIRIAGWSPFCTVCGTEKYTDILQPDSAGRLQSAGCGNDKLYDCTGSCTHDSGRFAGKEKDEILAFVTRPFTPGKLWELLPDAELFTSLIDFAQETVNGNFLEGYWSDHWDYNLDLIEEYLAVFPEKEVEMLTEKTYTFFLSQININSRVRRYVLTGRGVRQYHALNETSRRNTKEKLVRGAFGKGEIIYTTLLEKLILLCATKFAALDPYGMGIEMEGGKPGWYDALNGLPGIFGSSMAETYELYRMLTYTIGALQKVNAPVQILKELGTFLDELQLINRLENDAIAKQQELLSFGITSTMQRRFTAKRPIREVR